MHIGEPCRQILEGHFSSSPAAGDNNNRSSNNLHNDTRRSGSVQSELLVLCDKSLFLLKGETGGVIQQRRLERADASCMCIVPASVGGRESGGSSGNFLLAGQDATVQVYSGFNLGKCQWRFISLVVHVMYWLLVGGQYNFCFLFICG